MKFCSLFLGQTQVLVVFCAQGLEEFCSLTLQAHRLVRFQALVLLRIRVFFLGPTHPTLWVSQGEFYWKEGIPSALSLGNFSDQENSILYRINRMDSSAPKLSKNIFLSIFFLSKVLELAHHLLSPQRVSFQCHLLIFFVVLVGGSLLVLWTLSSAIHE